MAELNSEFIEKLRQASTILVGEVEHTAPVKEEDIRADILKCIPDTIIATVDISVRLADLMEDIWHLTGTRMVNDIECAEFMVLAPFVLRIALLGTNLCGLGEYVMFREGFESEDIAPVLLRQGIQT